MPGLRVPSAPTIDESLTRTDFLPHSFELLTTSGQPAPRGADGLSFSPLHGKPPSRDKGWKVVRILQGRPRGATLTALRRATSTDHHSVDALIDAGRLVEIGYYVAVLRGLIEAAEVVERTLPLIPQEMCDEGLSPAEVTKRVAIDAESWFLDDLVGPRPTRRPTSGDDRLVPSGSPVPGTMLGLLYVYVGSALGGLHLLRIARTAPWWRHEREHLLLRPYADRLGERWAAVLNALERLDAEGTNAAVLAAGAGFDLHHRSLVEQLVIGGVT